MASDGHAKNIHSPVDTRCDFRYTLEYFRAEINARKKMRKQLRTTLLVVVLILSGCDTATHQSSRDAELATDVEHLKAEPIDVQHAMPAEPSARYSTLAFEALHLTSRHEPEADAPSIHETDAALQQLLAGADDLPERHILQRNVGFHMLVYALPSVEEGNLDPLRLQYAELMVEGMSHEFLVLLHALESIEGYDNRVADVAHRALVNTHVLERVHRERQSRWTNWEDNLPDELSAEEAQAIIDEIPAGELEKAIERERKNWPPQMRTADGQSITRPNMNHLRDRLEALTM